MYRGMEAHATTQFSVSLSRELHCNRGGRCMWTRLDRPVLQFYRKLWYGNDEVLPNFDIHKNFVGSDATINSSDVEQFCAVVGNQGESFKIARNGLSLLML
jgi:hypothetical protein